MTTEATQSPHYPVEVQLSGTDGNAFSILAAVDRALRAAGAPGKDLDAFHREATSGDYDHLLRTCLRWVDVR